MTRLLLLLPLLLLACARPLTPSEAAFAKNLLGDDLQTQSIRLAPFTALTTISQRRPPRPRVACRERIWPAPTVTKGTVETFTAAFVTFNRLNIADTLFEPDYLPAFPDQLSLPAAMFIGHELTHVWQWQNRATTGYSPLKAAGEHRPGTDPYLLDLASNPAFLDFPFEQQASIVEEFICCTALDPKGGRTARLRDMLRPFFPADALAGRLENVAISVPWQGVKRRGICS